MSELKNSEKNGKKKSNGIANLVPFKPGHIKIGGKQKGYKSAKVVLREMLSDLQKNRDPKKITFLQAILHKQIDIAIKTGDRDAVRFVLEQAGDLIFRDPQAGNSFYDIDIIKNIGKTDFLDADDEDVPIIEKAKTINETNT